MGRVLCLPLSCLKADHKFPFLKVPSLLLHQEQEGSSFHWRWRIRTEMSCINKPYYTNPYLPLGPPYIFQSFLHNLFVPWNSNLFFVKMIYKLQSLTTYLRFISFFVNSCTCEIFNKSCIPFLLLSYCQLNLQALVTEPERVEETSLMICIYEL